MGCAQGLLPDAQQSERVGEEAVVVSVRDPVLLDMRVCHEDEQQQHEQEEKEASGEYAPPARVLRDSLWRCAQVLTRRLLSPTSLHRRQLYKSFEALKCDALAFNAMASPHRKPDLRGAPSARVGLGPRAITPTAAFRRHP